MRKADFIETKSDAYLAPKSEVAEILARNVYGGNLPAESV